MIQPTEETKIGVSRGHVRYQSLASCFLNVDESITILILCPILYLDIPLTKSLQCIPIIAMNPTSQRHNTTLLHIPNPSSRHPHRLAERIIAYRFHVAKHKILRATYIHIGLLEGYLLTRVV
jgi:hypothetical protein